MYGTDVSRETITGAVSEDLTVCQNRPLGKVYPVMVIGAIMLLDRAPLQILPTSKLRARAADTPEGAWEDHRFQPNLLTDDDSPAPRYLPRGPAPAGPRSPSPA